MTVPAIKLALKDPRNANVFDEENDFEILPEGVPASKRVNVLVGKRSTGKTFTLERIMDSLDQGDYAYIKQFGITEGAVDDTFRKNSDQEDDAFAEEHFSAVQDMLSDCLACTDDNKNKVCDFCEAVVTFAKSPEDTCSSYPLFTAKAFSTDSMSKVMRRCATLLLNAALRAVRPYRGKYCLPQPGRSAYRCREKVLTEVKEKVLTPRDCGGNPGPKRDQEENRMYSQEQRKTAIETFIRFDHSYADTIAELGYPTRAALRIWWNEYKRTGEVPVSKFATNPRYTEEMKASAVEHYLEHGKSLARTMRALGYPKSEASPGYVGR